MFVVQKKVVPLHTQSSNKQLLKQKKNSKQLLK